METRMNVFITIKPKIKSRELYEKLVLSQKGINVTDVGDKVYVYTQIDIREDDIERILAICKDYGDCSVDAHLVNETPSE